MKDSSSAVLQSFSGESAHFWLTLDGMAVRIGLGQLKCYACGYLERVSAGETLEIVRRGRLVAFMVPPFPNHLVTAKAPAGRNHRLRTQRFRSASYGTMQRRTSTESRLGTLSTLYVTAAWSLASWRLIHSPDASRCPTAPTLCFN